MKSRQDELQDWLINTLKLNIQAFDKLAGDASFRHYYRIQAHFPEKQLQSYIAMDSPPTHEKNQEFVTINHLLNQKKVRVPQIHAINLHKGFMLLEDFGNLHFFEILTPENKARYYQKAVDVIHQIQAPLSAETIKQLPAFSKDYMREELTLFEEWFLKAHLSIELNDLEIKLIHQCFDYLVNAIDKHPKTLIHRDFHSRNLMILSDDSIGVIDFQDAMIGPRSYDLVSLLKDCYIAHAEAFQVLGLKKFKAHDIIVFQQEYHLCGLQRHLKVLGIFSRLYHRDGKSRYLADLPLVLDYTFKGLDHIPELSTFHHWLKKRVLKAFQQKVGS